ncbi:MAG: hypothetical protein RR461_08920, partial [Angelakisella sp.]
YAQLAQSYLELVGPPEFTEEELEAAKSFGDGTGLHRAILPLPEYENFYGGATDEGDVSWVVPHVSIYTANMAQNTNGHTLQFTCQANMPAAYTAMVTQVSATSAMLLGLMQSPEQMAALKAAHKAKMGHLIYPKNPNYTLPPAFNPNCAGVTVEDGSITVDMSQLILLPKGFSGTVCIEKEGKSIATFTQCGTVQGSVPLRKGDSLYIYAVTDTKQLIGYYNI